MGKSPKVSVFVDWMDHVLRADIKPTTKLVCYVIRHHFGPDGSGSWPSVDRIKALSGVSRATVFEALKEAEQACLLQRSRRYNAKGRQTSNLYVAVYPDPSASNSVDVRGPESRPLEGSRIWTGEGPESGPRTSPEGKESSLRSDSSASGYSSAFETWWSSYPLKKAKAKAWAIWKQKKLDAQLEPMIEKLHEQLRDDRQFLRGFIPHPTTYLNQQRWEDEIEKLKEGENGKGGRRLSAVEEAAEDRRRFEQRERGVPGRGNGSSLGAHDADLREPLEGEVRSRH